MNCEALVIVDMQTALVEAEPYNRAVVIENIKALLAACRKRGISVVYIQHDGGSGGELEHGSAGWIIYKEITPLPGEKNSGETVQQRVQKNRAARLSRRDRREKHRFVWHADGILSGRHLQSGI